MANSDRTETNKTQNTSIDPFSGGNVGYPFSYYFIDLNNLPIPNSLGYKFIRMLKGTTNLTHDEVRLVLARYDRESLYKQLQAIENS